MLLSQGRAEMWLPDAGPAALTCWRSLCDRASPRGSNAARSATGWMNSNSPNQLLLSDGHLGCFHSSDFIILVK